METLPIARWLNKELSSLLECEIGDEYSKNILNIETEEEIKEFIGSLLDLSIQKNKNFLDELCRKLKKPSSVPDVKVYRKPEAEETFKSKKPVKSSLVKQDELEVKQIDKKIYISTSGKSARKSCECQATKHKLIANCLKCGRIVCAEEGSGPCFFCGNLVCTREELEKIRSGSNKGERLRQELLNKTWNHLELIGEKLENIQLDQNKDDALKRAIAHKDKLIDFDRTSAKRTQVIDDESDYFNTNSKWMTQQQRALLEAKQEEVREKRFGSRLNNKFTLDFAGRKVIDEQKNVDLKQYANEIEEILKDKSLEQQNTVFNQSIVDIAPKFIEDKSKKSSMSKKLVTPNEKENKYRIQDQGLLEMKDEGMCLSMHQPWASLLVMGIKKHEGRSWYTPHRGRLWIHAGSKQPTEADLSETESFYRHYYSDRKISFPSSYPTSCLLGYVDLDDCLSADAYRNQFPNGESDSEFVFICKNPRELYIKIPMSGQHKIFKLDKSVHISAKKSPVIYYDEDDNEYDSNYDDDDI